MRVSLITIFFLAIIVLSSSCTIFSTRTEVKQLDKRSFMYGCLGGFVGGTNAEITKTIELFCLDLYEALKSPELKKEIDLSEGPRS